MTNEKRIEIEKRIVRKYLSACIEAGLTPVRMDTGDGSFEYNRENLFEADECAVWFSNGAMLYFVYGNAPGEVLCDYSVSLEDVVSPVNKYAEQYL